MLNEDQVERMRVLASAAYAVDAGCIYLRTNRPGRRPTVWFCGTMMSASRAVWMLRHGDPGDEQFVLHRCHNGDRGCISIMCLYLGDQTQNMADMKAAGRLYWGARSNLAKLTNEQVREIRERYRPDGTRGSATRLATELGIEYGVARQTIVRIATGETYNINTDQV